MQFTCAVLLAFALYPTLDAAVCAAEPWPADSGIEIGRAGDPGHLPIGYEPSGAVWHEGRSRLLIVGDSGTVSEMTADGDSLATWTVGGDLEGIALPDPTADLVLLGREQPDAILEFDLATGTLTGTTWDLTPWMTGPANRGLEGLTIVDGLAFAGLQDTGEIFVFDLKSGGVVAHQSTIPSPLGLDDVSGLHYDPQTGILFVLHDTHDRLVEMLPDGTLQREYDAAGNDQEGFALIGGHAPGSTSVFIAEDTAEVWRYTGYPVELPPGTHVPDRRLLTLEAQPYPNPFRHESRLRFDLGAGGSPIVAIHDLLGRRVRTLTSSDDSTGSTELVWDGTDDRGQRLPAGSYYFRLVTPAGTASRRVTLLR